MHYNIELNSSAKQTDNHRNFTSLLVKNFFRLSIKTQDDRMEDILKHRRLKILILLNLKFLNWGKKAPSLGANDAMRQEQK